MFFFATVPVVVPPNITLTALLHFEIRSTFQDSVTICVPQGTRCWKLSYLKICSAVQSCSTIVPVSALYAQKKASVIGQPESLQKQS